MKFKFKVQQYQTDDADAVTSVFEGQPNQGASVYLRDLGIEDRNRSKRQMQASAKGALMRIWTKKGMLTPPLRLAKMSYWTIYVPCSAVTNCMSR